MPKEEDNSESLGICHRIINFIMNNLISQGFKRVTVGRAASRESNEVPIADFSRNLKNTVWPSNSNGHGALSPDIVIEFRHVEGPDNSTPVQNFAKKNGLILTDDHRALQLQKKNEQRKERRHFEAATSSSTMVSLPEKTDAAVSRMKIPHQEWDESPAPTRRRGPKSMVSIRKESAGDTEKYNNKTETTSSGNETEETKMKPLRHPRPLLMSVASNINEKADAFIRSRKEAMSKHYSSDHKNF